MDAPVVPSWAAAFPAQWGVTAELGDTPASLDGPALDYPYMQVADDAVLVRMEGVARMLVTADRLVLDPAPGVPPEDADYLVYGWAPRLVRVLRGQFALHASAVVTPAGALAVLGDPRAGKSTTVLALHAAGFPLLVDDVLPVDVDGGVATVHGWPRPVHVFDHTAERLGLPVEGVRRLGRADGKLALDMPQATGPVPLRAAVLLRPDDVDAVEVEPLTGAQRLAAVSVNVDLRGTSSAGGRQPAFFRWAASVADAVPMTLVRRPREGWHVDAVVAAVLGALAPAAGAGG